MHISGLFSTCILESVARASNRLLVNYAGADGMKTGFTCDSGFNIVASANRDGHKLIAVVLGENTGGQRNLRTTNLLEHGFQTYQWKALFPSASIDDMPLADDAKGPTSIRQTVISWVCGTARRAGRQVEQENRRRRPRRRTSGKNREESWQACNTGSYRTAMATLVMAIEHHHSNLTVLGQRQSAY